MESHGLRIVLLLRLVPGTQPRSVGKAVELGGTKGRMADGFGFTEGAGAGMVSARFLARFGRRLTIWRRLD